MSKYLHDTLLRDLIAPSIADDATVKAVAEALDPILQSLYRQTPQLLIWSRLLQTAGLGVEPHNAPLARVTEAAGGLKNLPTEMLEQLAWQLHVDFREAAKDDRQLAGLVANSIPWHRIKGTPASLKAALRLCGFGQDIEIEEDGAGTPYWATYQLGLPEIVSHDDLKRIVEICQEMQPARCSLWRVYTQEYDWRPGVWGAGAGEYNKFRHAWSYCWWSGYSGAYDGDIGDGLIVSFGKTDRFQTESFAPDALIAALGMEQLTGFLAPYIDRPVWSRSFWGEEFPRNHGFVIGQLHSLHWCELLTTSYPWSGAWDKRHWQEKSEWDRILPKWKFRKREWAKVEVVPSWPGDGREAGPIELHSNGTWGDINASYGRPHAVIFKGVSWGDKWGADVERQELEILERHRERQGIATAAVEPGKEAGNPQQAGQAFFVMQAPGLRDNQWRGAWGGKWGNFVQSSIRSES